MSSKLVAAIAIAAALVGVGMIVSGSQSEAPPNYRGLEALNDATNQHIKRLAAQGNYEGATLALADAIKTGPETPTVVTACEREYGPQFAREVHGCVLSVLLLKSYDSDRAKLRRAYRSQ